MAKRTTRIDVMTAIAIWPPVARGRGAASGVKVGVAVNCAPKLGRV